MIITVVGKLLGFGREPVIVAYFGGSPESAVDFMAPVIPDFFAGYKNMYINSNVDCSLLSHFY